jgi:hypothetical protein
MRPEKSTGTAVSFIRFIGFIWFIWLKLLAYAISVD